MQRRIDLNLANRCSGRQACDMIITTYRMVLQTNPLAHNLLSLLRRVELHLGCNVLIDFLAEQELSDWVVILPSSSRPSVHHRSNSLFLKMSLFGLWF